MEKIQVIQPTKLLAPYIKQYWFFHPTNKPRENCLKLLFFAEVEKKKKL